MTNLVKRINRIVQLPESLGAGGRGAAGPASPAGGRREALGAGSALFPVPWGAPVSPGGIGVAPDGPCGAATGGGPARGTLGVVVPTAPPAQGMSGVVVRRACPPRLPLFPGSPRGGPALIGGRCGPAHAQRGAAGRPGPEPLPSAPVPAPARPRRTGRGRRALPPSPLPLRCTGGPPGPAR